MTADSLEWLPHCDKPAKLSLPAWSTQGCCKGWLRPSCGLLCIPQTSLSITTLNVLVWLSSPFYKGMVHMVTRSPRWSWNIFQIKLFGQRLAQLTCGKAAGSVILNVMLLPSLNLTGPSKTDLSVYTEGHNTEDPSCSFHPENQALILVFGKVRREAHWSLFVGLKSGSWLRRSCTCARRLSSHELCFSARSKRSNQPVNKQCLGNHLLWGMLFCICVIAPERRVHAITTLSLSFTLLIDGRIANSFQDSFTWLSTYYYYYFLSFQTVAFQALPDQRGCNGATFPWWFDVNDPKVSKLVTWWKRPLSGKFRDLGLPVMNQWHTTNRW